MATRLYFPRIDAPIDSPTQDAAWDVTTGFVRRNLDTGKYQYDWYADYAQFSTSTTGNTPAGASDGLMVQYISPKLSGNQTIGGGGATVKGQMSFAESNAAADMRHQGVLWVMKPDGTSRGTLLAADAAALSSEFSVAGTVTNRKAPRGGAATLSTVNALDGDRIVWETGYRKHENATTSRTATLISGAVRGSSDFAEDETDTNQTKAGWLEFSQDLTFQTPTMRVSQVSRRVLIEPDDAVIRVSQVSRRVLVADAVIIPNNAYVVWVD